MTFDMNAWMFSACRTAPIISDHASGFYQVHYRGPVGAASTQSEIMHEADTHATRQSS